jgi:hypothetical protein
LEASDREVSKHFVYIEVLGTLKLKSSDIGQEIDESFAIGGVSYKFFGAGADAFKGHEFITEVLALDKMLIKLGTAGKLIFQQLNGVILDQKGVGITVRNGSTHHLFLDDLIQGWRVDMRKVADKFSQFSP